MNGIGIVETFRMALASHAEDVRWLALALFSAFCFWAIRKMGGLQ